MSYRVEKGKVILELTPEQFDRILIMAGYATGAAQLRGDSPVDFIRLVNEINEGNPHFTPYQIPKSNLADRLCGQSSEPEAYKAGFDCGVNGANISNCHFRFFATREMTSEWERGKRDAGSAKARGTSQKRVRQ